MQAIHGNRTIYNVRNGWDIARFLADAVKEDVESHLGNLKCALQPINSMLHHVFVLPVYSFVRPGPSRSRFCCIVSTAGRSMNIVLLWQWQEIAGGAAIQIRLGISRAAVTLGGACAAEF